MNLTLATVLTAFVISLPLGSLAVEPDLQAFVKAYEAALKAGNIDVLDSMYHIDRKSVATVERLKENLEQQRIEGQQVESVKLEPAKPDRWTGPLVRNGEITEPSLPIVGYLHVKYAKRAGGGVSASSVPYGFHDGKPYLVGTKVTKLLWDGPPEEYYFLQVNTSDEHKVTFGGRYMASGLEREIKEEVDVNGGAFGLSIFANEIRYIEVSTKGAGNLKVELTKGSGEKRVKLLEVEIDSNRPLLYEPTTR